jgi:hypothetical protein
MTSHAGQHRRAPDEAGSALIMALLFLALFGLLVGGILSLTQANLKATTAIRSKAATLYSANAAVDGAINSVQALGTGSSVGVAPYNSTCFSLPAAQVNSFGQINVNCQATSGSGAMDLTQQPAQGILTTGAGGATEGVTVTSGLTYDQGDVKTRVLTTTASTLNQLAVTSGSVRATSCSPTTLGARVTATPGTVSCAAAAVPVDPAADPGLSAPVQASWSAPVGPTTAVTAPTCPVAASPWVVSFSPGLYNSGAAFQAALACANKVVWFRPGVYYLDFTDATAANRAVTINTTGTNTNSIVGGVPSGWDPAAATRPTIPLPTAASPSTSACDKTLPGVVFVLGGDSTITATSAKLQICGWWNTTSPAQHFAFDALSNDVTANGQVNNLAPTTAANATGQAPWTNWTTPTAVTATDGTYASWTSYAGGSQANPTHSVYLQITYPNLNVPIDATIVSMTATITHTMSGTGGALRADILLPDGTMLKPANRPFRTCLAACTFSGSEVVDFTPQTPPTATQVNSAIVRIQTDGYGAAAGSFTEKVDSVFLTVNYTYPLVHGSTATSTSAVLTLNGDSAAANPSIIAIHGTVYAILNVVNVGVLNAVTTVIDRGIVARHVQLSMTRAAGFSGPLVSIPPSGPRDVVFTASSTAGVALLRAEVVFSDATGATDGTVAKIRTWGHL